MTLLFLAALTACGADKQVNSDFSENKDTGAVSNIPAGGTNKNEASSGSHENKVEGDVGSNKNNPADNSEISDEIDSDENEAPTDDLEQVLLQSASIDLDNDGINEQVKAVRRELPASGEGGTDLFEGRLLINDADDEKQIVFREKDNDLAGLLTNMQFEDLDGDGAKDIFITLPGYGASFSYSNYFIYSYKKDISYSFSSDNTLADFIGAFEFSYTKGGSKLTVTNESYGFEADLTIEDLGEGTQAEDVMYNYADGTWIDPVSVDISEASRLALVKNNGRAEIKVPLPVFGMATVNMIAEVDLFYQIDENFEPVLKRCEVIDFQGQEKIKAGSFELTGR